MSPTEAARQSARLTALEVKVVSLETTRVTNEVLLTRIVKEVSDLKWTLRLVALVVALTSDQSSRVLTSLGVV